MLALKRLAEQAIAAGNDAAAKAAVMNSVTGVCRHAAMRAIACMQASPGRGAGSRGRHDELLAIVRVWR